MATQVTEKEAKKLATLLAEVKALSNELDSLSKKQERASIRLYVATWDWVEATLEAGRAATVQAACIRLGAMLKRTRSNVESWYYCGRFMYQEGLTIAHDHRSVRAVYYHRRSLSKAELIRCVDLIKKKEPWAKVRTIINKSKRAKTREAEAKVRRMIGQKQFTRTRMKMELMGLQTMLAKFFKEPVFITVKGQESERTLLEVK